MLAEISGSVVRSSVFSGVVEAEDGGHGSGAVWVFAALAWRSQKMPTKATLKAYNTIQ